MDMDTNVAVDGLSNQECGDFRLVCRLYELYWSDFEVHVEYEPVGGFGRKGRKLVHALYRISGRHRTYRAGAGNNWISAFEEDVTAYCFTSLSRKLPSRSSNSSGTHTGKL
jgi:hypothetical protein